MAQEISSERRAEVTNPGSADQLRRVRRGRRAGRRLERRAVRVDDPSLSPDTNQRLTVELQEAVGATSVEVPADRPHVSLGEPASAGTTITINRVILAMSLAIVLVIASIVALSTGSWWLLPVAAAVHATGTLLVVVISVRLTRDVEHPSPSLAAAMNEDGVVGADHRFSEMVEEFQAPELDADGPWQNERTVRPQEDAVTASVQQSRSLTATSQPSEPAPDPRSTDLLTGVLGAGVAVASLIIPAVAGGSWLWLLPAVIVPLCAGGVVMNLMVKPGNGGQAAAALTPSRAIIGLWAATVVSVAVFCALIVLFVAH